MPENKSASFNPSQKEAIEHVEGPMMVLAGPGSGKTFVITNRLYNMVQNEGINPENILVITFTKASADEMRERFEKMTEDCYYPITFGTFHAVFFNIIRSTPYFSGFTIVTEKEKRLYMKTVLDTLAETKTLGDKNIEMFLDSVSKVKNAGISPCDYSQDYCDKEVFAKVYEEYASMLRDENKIDFDDMVFECDRLLSENEDILQKWRDKYRYFLIDEFQDINPLQYKIICMLSSPLDNLFIVGDDDQSIYGFRGSCPEIMLGFEKDYPACKRVLLSINYRSTSEIVDNAVRFIKHNKARFDKKLSAACQGGMEPSVRLFESHDEESDYIIELIKSLRRITKYKDIALIFRTNAAAGMLIKALLDAGIPFCCKEKPDNIFDHPIIKDIMAIFLYSYGEKSRENLFRFVNKPYRYISRSLFANDCVSLESILFNRELKPYIKDNIYRLARDLDKLKSMDLFCGYKYIMNGMKYKEYVYEKIRDKSWDSDEVEAIKNEFQKMLHMFDNPAELQKYIKDYECVLKNSTESRGDNRDNKGNKENNIQNENDDDGVRIVTMHGSKGLEYNTVILPGVNEGIIPGSRSAQGNLLEEERRVFYVALTRAKKRLYITAINKNKNNRKPPSRFLNELNR